MIITNIDEASHKHTQKKRLVVRDKLKKRNMACQKDMIHAE